MHTCAKCDIWGVRRCAGGRPTTMSSPNSALLLGLGRQLPITNLMVKRAASLAPVTRRVQHVAGRQVLRADQHGLVAWGPRA